MAQNRNQTTSGAIEALALLDIQTKLATLWAFRLFNVLFRDIHELARPGMIEEMMTGVVNGTPVTEELLLVGGFMVEIPILMVVLSRFLPYRFNRWLNIFIAIITIATTLVLGAGDLDDVFFAAIEIVALLIIILIAWRWRK